MKVLVLGAAGMAGHVISIYLSEHGYEVTGFARHKTPYCDCIIGDAFNSEELKNILLSGNYDAVINCIGILNQFADNNPDEAIYINSYLPHYIVSLLKDTETRFIQMSTDCVFAGNTGPYTEESLPDGTSIYDKTKALGEINNIKDLTFRNSIIGPDINERGIGLFNWFMKQKGTINGYTSAIWTGVTTITLAKAMDYALKARLTGLYNLVNNESISKYNLLKLFNKYFKNNEIGIRPNDELKLDKTLVCTRTDFNFKVPTYDVMIQDMKEWVYSHKDIYPEYYLNK